MAVKLSKILSSGNWCGSQAVASLEENLWFVHRVISTFFILSYTSYSEYRSKSWHLQWLLTFNSSVLLVDFVSSPRYACSNYEILYSYDLGSGNGETLNYYVLCELRFIYMPTRFAWKALLLKLRNLFSSCTYTFPAEVQLLFLVVLFFFLWVSSVYFWVTGQFTGYFYGI